MSGCSSSSGSKGAAKGGGGGSSAKNAGSSVQVPEHEALAMSLMDKITNPDTTVEELNNMKTQLQAAASANGVKDFAQHADEFPAYAAARQAINDIKAGRKAIVDKAIQEKIDKQNAKKEAAKQAKYAKLRQQEEEERAARREAARIAYIKRGEEWARQKEEAKANREKSRKNYEAAKERNRQQFQEQIQKLSVGGSFKDNFGNNYTKTIDGRVWKNNRPLLAIGETYRDAMGNLWENADGRTVNLGSWL